jgi:probable HAF family extracellular repeat protein
MINRPVSVAGALAPAKWIFFYFMLAAILAQPAFCDTPPYKVFDLGTLGGALTTAHAINDSGQVAGSSYIAGNGASHPFLWTNGVMTDLGTLGGASGDAYGINGFGEVVGSATTQGNTAIHAFLYKGGAMHDLGVLPGFNNCVAQGINDSGQVVGYCFGPGTQGFRAFLYSGGVMTGIGTLGGDTSYATAINDGGEVVGSADIAGNQGRHAFLYSAGIMHDLGTLGGSGSEAFGVNALGQVVGLSDVPGDEFQHAFVFRFGHMQDLGVLPGAQRSWARGINNAGTIVGLAPLPGVEERAFRFQDEVLQDVNALLVPDSLPQGVFLSEALGINAPGQIIANSANNLHGYLLSVNALLAITGPDSLPTGMEGTPYGPAPFTVTGGSGQYHWSASGLPAGLAINPATGVLSGTPARSSHATYLSARITVTDSAGAIVSVARPFTIEPAAAGPQLPLITSASPNPVPGTGLRFCINGSGFIDGPEIRVRLTWPAGQIDTPITFFNPEQLCLVFNFGLGSGNWTAQVINGDGALSNIFSFSVMDPSLNTATHLALPQFAFGGPWYSALYLSNTTADLVTVPVTFTDPAGAPLLVPLVGIGSISSRNVTVDPGATVLLEALNGGDALVVGWADVALPPGVIGYGVFRQVVAGRADQEAVVPLTPESSRRADFTFDDVSLTTAVSFLNPTNQEVTATVVAITQDGGQAGFTQMVLAPHTKSTGFLKDFPGMAGVSGNRGRVVVTVPIGAVSVLALRFAGAAFADIPINYR